MSEIITRWLVRVAVAELLVIVLLSVWLWDSRRTPHDVEHATREYVEARQNFDTLKVIRTRDVHHYRALRDTLRLTDTTQVRSALTLADDVIRKDSVALAVADIALAKADTLISALRKANKPKLIEPYIEFTHNPHSKEYAGRLGIEVRTVRNVSLIAATEIRKEGTGFAVGLRYVF